MPNDTILSVIIYAVFCVFVWNIYIWRRNNMYLHEIFVLYLRRNIFLSLGKIFLGTGVLKWQLWDGCISWTQGSIFLANSEPTNAECNVPMDLESVKMHTGTKCTQERGVLVRRRKNIKEHRGGVQGNANVNRGNRGYCVTICLSNAPPHIMFSSQDLCRLVFTHFLPPPLQVVNGARMHCNLQMSPILTNIICSPAAHRWLCQKIFGWTNCGLLLTNSVLFFGDLCTFKHYTHIIQQRMLSRCLHGKWEMQLHGWGDEYEI